MESAKFDLQSTDTPTEKELAKKLLVILKGDHSEAKFRTYVEGMQ